MQQLLNKYSAIWGYSVSVEEIYNAYTTGELTLSDREENALHAELEMAGLI